MRKLSVQTIILNEESDVSHLKFLKLITRIYKS